MTFFGLFLLLILVVMLTGPFVPAISDYALPIVGILFLIGGWARDSSPGPAGRSFGGGWWRAWADLRPPSR